jgi:putative transposase
VLIRRDSLEAVLVIDALGMATSHRTPAPGAIHHSDRGSQYGAAVYGRTLRESGLAQSMGRRGSALDNAACESVMATFKTELVNRRSFHTPDQAREHVFRWIEGWYNPRRRHSSLGYLSPEAYESTHQIGGDHATTNGRAAPADPDQPALPEGALIGIGNPTRPHENVSTEPR